MHYQNSTAQLSDRFEQGFPIQGYIDFSIAARPFLI